MSINRAQNKRANNEQLKKLVDRQNRAIDVHRMRTAFYSEYYKKGVNAPMY